MSKQKIEDKDKKQELVKPWKKVQTAEGWKRDVEKIKQSRGKKSLEKVSG